MAQELRDGEFWLPSEILTDDDLLMDFKSDLSKTKTADDLSSATETESDEDDFITHTSKRMRITGETAPFKPFVKTPTPQTEASLAFLHLQATNFQQHHSMWKIDREIGRSQGLSMASWPSVHSLNSSKLPFKKSESEPEFFCQED
ncbi:hypothetical protein SASPL_108719 [Salvia splendens]|uniref:Uncharacterized protein n=1 Tax=Salvia splendens TaxID=180675 RepID=A0A8X9A6G2_SALSN|nr:hypothetical protein SASPL_108719 [Salvia splendens]